MPPAASRAGWRGVALLSSPAPARHRVVMVSRANLVTDPSIVPALLAATAAILLAAVIVAAHLTPRGTIAFVVAAILLAQAMVVGTVGIAGILLQSLAPAVLLAVAGAWLAVALIGARLHRAPVRWRERSARGVAALLSALAEPPVAIAAGLIVVTLAWRAFLAFRLPLVDYDGWSYHMVIVDVWFQHSALTLVPHRPWTAGYPSVQELVTTWLVAFTGTDSLAGLTSLVPIPAAIATTAGLARSFGANRSWALLAGLLFGMTPALVVLTGTSYVDAASITVVTATWWLGLRVIRGERDRSAALLLGIAGGLAAGTKGANVLLVAPILAVAGLVIARDLFVRRAGGDPPAVVIGRLAVLVVPFLLLGASWYIKNLVAYGNPMYPFRFGPLPGVTTFTDFAFVPPQLEGKNLITQLLTSWTADWRLERYVYNQRPGGLGRAWPLILALAAGGGLVLVRRRMLDALALVVLPAAIALLVMPMPWYARYTLFLVAVSLSLTGALFTATPQRLARIGGLALVAVATISLAYANVRPNIDIRAAFDDQARWPGYRQYIEYVLDPSEERRMSVSLRAQCAGFDVIPAGERVVPGGFNLLHGVVGPGLDRILTDPLRAARDPEAVSAAMRELDAAWLVTSAGGGLDGIVASAPELFEPFGETCRTARIWRLRPGS